MVVRGRRSLRLLVLGVVCATACKIALEDSQQTLIAFPENTTFTTPVNVPTTAKITISPANDKISSLDRIQSIVALSECKSWKLNLPTTPVAVANNCGSAGTAQTLPEQQNAGSNCVATKLEFSPEFAPRDPGIDICTLEVRTDTQRVQLTLTGNATPLAVDLRLAESFGDPVTCNPCSAEFGDVDVGLPSAPVNLEIRNVGEGKATITKLQIDNPLFSIVGGDPGEITIEAGEKTSVQVQCNPVAPTEVENGLLVLISDNANTEVAQTLAMSCRGIQSDLQFLAGANAISQVDLTTRVHEQASQTLALRNKGTAPMEVTEFQMSIPNDDISFHLPGQSQPLTLPLSISANAQTTIEVRFTPREAVGDLGKLTVVFDAGQRDLVLTGSALATTIETILDPPSLGKLCVGDTRTVAILVRASGDGEIELRNIDSNDTDHAQPFELTLPAATFPFALEPQRQTEYAFTVEAAPTSVAAMSILLATDIPRDGFDNTTIAVDLPAEILPEGVAGPESTVFEPVDRETEAFARAIDISNCTNAPVTITGAAISNGDFEIVDGAFTEIPPLRTVTYQVAMKTDTPGAKVATLRVTGSFDTVDVPLSGEVLGAFARDSYYACSTGQPGGWLLVFGGLVFVLRRRRR